MINQLVKFMAHHLRDLGYIWQKGAEMGTQRPNFKFPNISWKAGYVVSSVYALSENRVCRNRVILSLIFQTFQTPHFGLGFPISSPRILVPQHPAAEQRGKI